MYVHVHSSRIARCPVKKTDDGLNVTIDSTDGGSQYVPTPKRIVRKNACVVRNVASNTVCFMNLNQFDKFIKQVDEIRCCATQGRSQDFRNGGAKEITRKAREKKFFFEYRKPRPTN